MTHGTNALLVDGDRRQDTARVPRVLLGGRGDRLLAGVAAAFVLAQLVLVPPGMGLGWDEVVYASQVGAQGPASWFSAPRARGVSLLAAPVASWSTSTELLRVWFALLAGAGLLLALRVWRGLFADRVLAGAGALFASLWVTLFYGPQVMPNYWVAIGALVTVGSFLKGRAGGVAAGTVLMALMRPTDAVWTVLPLLVLALCARRPRPLLALLGGLALGAAPWVVEAYVRFGGLAERLREGARVQGGLGWTWAVDDHLRSLVGRTLCRPCTAGMPGPAVTAWWYVLPVLVALGVVVAVRARRARPTLVAVACALAAAFPYLFLVGYAAPRFLLPAYALLALPVADGVLHAVRDPRGRPRPVLTAVVAVALLAHLAVQYVVLDRVVSRTVDARAQWRHAAEVLHRLGVEPPCLVTGHEALPIAYYAGCASASVGGPNANATAEEIAETAERVPAAHLVAEDGAPASYARDWRPFRLGGQIVRIGPAVRD